jgi:hypothetical protein
MDTNIDDYFPSGYPLAIFHRHFLYGKNAKLQHIFFILCGVGIGVFNYSKNRPVEDAILIKNNYN